MIKHSAGEMQQHSTLQSIVLHLLPGAIPTAVYVLMVPFAAALGNPSITVLYLPMILTVPGSSCWRLWCIWFGGNAISTSA